jgi:hypothetical protein
LWRRAFRGNDAPGSPDAFHGLTLSGIVARKIVEQLTRFLNTAGAKEQFGQGAIRNVGQERGCPQPQQSRKLGNSRNSFVSSIRTRCGWGQPRSTFGGVTDTFNRTLPQMKS